MDGNGYIVSLTCQILCQSDIIYYMICKLVFYA